MKSVTTKPLNNNLTFQHFSQLFLKTRTALQVVPSGVPFSHFKSETVGLLVFKSNWKKLIEKKLAERDKKRTVELLQLNEVSC